MSELVHQGDFLHQVAADGAHQVVEVVLREALWVLRQPEGDVVDERGVFTEVLRGDRNNKVQLLCKETFYVLVSVWLIQTGLGAALPPSCLLKGCGSNHRDRL